MDTERLIEEFRSEVHDTAVPYLWSDEEVVGYLDEAQKWLCRMSGGISDSTSEITRVSMVTGEPWGVVDQKILKVRYVRRESDNVEIELMNFEDVQSRPVFTRGYYATLPTSILLDDTATGAVNAMVAGMEENRVRWLYVPGEDDTALMIVYRLPLVDITVDNIAPLEVNEKYHRQLKSGMKALAYDKEDAETFDKSKRDRFKTEFEGVGNEAKRERERREHKYRTITYGGI